MPRREKRTSRTGSMLLGAELRRLRGLRTLDEIAALSRAPPLAGAVPPISASTLSDVELGRQMPRLTTLYTLSMVHRVSMNQLMGYVAEEGLAQAAGATGIDANSDPALEFRRLLSISEWHRALPLAIHCERHATTDRERMPWRGNRATCLANIGLHAEAIDLLTTCLESGAVTPRQEFVILQLLADMHVAAGHFKTANGLVRDAIERIPGDALPNEVANLEAVRAGLIIDVQELAASADDRAVREAISLTERAESIAVDDPAARLRFRCMRARAYRLLGNRAVALRDLEAILREAVDLRYPRLEARAALEIARLRREAGHPAQAQALLERCKALGESGQQFDLVFEASLELFRLLRDEKPQVAVVHFRRCREILPLLPSHAPSVQAFELIAREIVG